MPVRTGVGAVQCSVNVRGQLGTCMEGPQVGSGYEHRCVEGVRCPRACMSVVVQRSDFGRSALEYSISFNNS